MGKSNNKIKITIIRLIVITISIISVFLIKSHLNISTTMGNYYGASDDNKWIIHFKVYEENNETLLKGDLVCLDEIIANKISEDKIEKNVITLMKNNGKGFGGKFIYDGVNKFTIINFVDNDKYEYNKIIIDFGNYNTQFKVSKEKE